LSHEALLQTHAEVAIALAGFASVVAALSRPLDAFARQRFLSLLALSLIQVLGCLLPLWGADLLARSGAAWRLMSAALLVLNLARLWYLVVLPGRTLDRHVRRILGPFVNGLVWTVGYTMLLLLLANTLGFPFQPSFHLYYAALLAGLLVGFALFADVAIDVERTAG
jgi:hypothetical protein